MEKLAEEVITAVGGHPSVRSMRLVGSRGEHRAMEASD
jgi:hypothetical protein